MRAPEKTINRFLISFLLIFSVQASAALDYEPLESDVRRVITSKAKTSDGWSITYSVYKEIERFYRNKASSRCELYRSELKDQQKRLSRFESRKGLLSGDLKNDLEAFQKGSLSCFFEGEMLLSDTWDELNKLSGKRKQYTSNEFGREVVKVVNGFITQVEIQRELVVKEYNSASSGYSDLKAKLENWASSQESLSDSQKHQPVHPDDEAAVTKLASALKVELQKLTGKIKYNGYWLGSLLEALERAEPGITQEVADLISRMAETGDFDVLIRSMAATMYPSISSTDPAWMYFPGLTYISSKQSLRIGDAGVLMLVALVSEASVSVYFESQGNEGLSLVVRFIEGQFYFYNQLPLDGGLYLKVTRELGDYRYLGHFFAKQRAGAKATGLINVSDVVDRESIKVQLHGQSSRPKAPFLKTSDPCYRSSERRCEIAMEWLLRRDNPLIVDRLIGEGFDLSGIGSGHAEGVRTLDSTLCHIWQTNGDLGSRFNKVFGNREGITTLYHQEMTETVLDDCHALYSRRREL